MTQTNSNKKLSRIVLRGFKSIASCDLELSKINILIGANGAGKSNFIGFFHMVQQLLEQNLQIFVNRQGSPDAILHFGREATEKLEFQLYFGDNGYFAELEPTQDNRFMFFKESFWRNMQGELNMGRGHFDYYRRLCTNIYTPTTLISIYTNFHVPVKYLSYLTK